MSNILGESYSKILEYYSEKTRAERTAPRGPGIDTLGQPIEQEVKSGFRTVYPSGLETREASGIKDVFQKIN